MQLLRNEMEQERGQVRPGEQGVGQLGEWLLVESCDVEVALLLELLVVALLKVFRILGVDEDNEKCQVDHVVLRGQHEWHHLLFHDHCQFLKYLD